MSQTQFTDHYEEVEIIGIGQSQVWKYTRKKDRQAVAVKIIHLKFLN